MLGLHRDSLVDLVSLSYHHEDDDDIQATDKETTIIEFTEALHENDKKEEDFVGLNIEDDGSDDKVKIFDELNNLAIISTAREKGIDERSVSINSASSVYAESEEDEYDYYDSYASSSVIWFENPDKLSRRKPFECFFNCFPFSSNNNTQKEQRQNLCDEALDQLNPTSSKVSDDASHNTSLYGKTLTESEHLAVLARLNLPEVRSKSMPPLCDLHLSPGLQKPDEGAGPYNQKQSKKLKGILKLPTPPQPGHLKSKSMHTFPETHARKRRSLFPTSNNTLRSHEKKNIKFISLAKVCTIPSLSSMSFLTRQQIWWQKTEYDDFKKAARIITKAMLTGGSEIWLSESKEKQISRSRTNEGAENDDGSSFGSKWWCKFGHSRRGLEHICKISEGRGRQRNVILATKSVVDEYRRQKVIGHFDDKRLASVSRQYTSWATDLAHAAALADQEGVRKNFSVSAKSRNDYVLQTLAQHHHNYDMSDCTINVGDVIGVSLPQQVNQTNSTSNISIATHDPHMLDAHTHSSLVYRKHQLKSQHKEALLEQQQRNGSDTSLKKKAVGYGVNGKKNEIGLPVIKKVPNYGVV